MALYTEQVTIVSCSIEGGNLGMAGMPHPIINGQGGPSADMAYVLIRSDDGSRRTFQIPQSTAARYVAGGLLTLTIDSAPAL